MENVITPHDLKPGQEKVVIYVGNKCTIIVPDKSWNLIGDLSQLTPEVRDMLEHYSKNGFQKKSAIVERTNPFGRKVLDDIDKSGFSVDGIRVVFLGEFDVRGNKI